LCIASLASMTWRLTLDSPTSTVSVATGKILLIVGGGHVTQETLQHGLLRRNWHLPVGALPLRREGGPSIRNLPPAKGIVPFQRPCREISLPAPPGCSGPSVCRASPSHSTIGRAILTVPGERFG
jgi:hypothetical protein